MTARDSTPHAPKIHPVPPTVFTPEEAALIRPNDIQFLTSIMSIGKELAYHSRMTVDEPPLEVTMSVLKEEWQYEIVFYYPPAITEMSADKISTFVRCGIEQGLIGHQDVTPGFELAFSPPRWFIRVRILMNDVPPPFRRKVSNTIIKQETTVYVPTGSFSSAAEGMAVYRRRDGTAFGQTGSPRNKRARLDGGTSSSNSSPQIQRGSANKHSSVWSSGHE